MKNQIIHLLTFIRNIRYNKLKLFVFHFKTIKEILFTLKITHNNQNSILSDRPVFILNACINPFDNIAFAAYSAPNDVSDRFQQVMNGIKSVKENFKTADIVYIENSAIPIEYELHLKSSVDYYFNFSHNNFLQYSRAISNKGIPWSMANMLCLIELSKLMQYSSYHFLNGRYQVSALSSEYFYSQTRNGFMHVKMKKHNITTTYFYFACVSIDRIFRVFKFAHIFTLCGFSIEDLFSVFFFKKRFISSLGISGRVNSVEKCEE